MLNTANKIIDMKSNLLKHNPDFILTLSDNWNDVVPHFDRTYPGSIFNNVAYVSLIENVGFNNIDYMFVNIFDSSRQTILGFEKDREGNRIHVGFTNGYYRFIPALTWALTTSDGVRANESKYKRVKPLLVPPNKLVFIVDVAKAGSVKSFDITRITDAMFRHKSAFAGFMVDSINSDMTAVPKSEYPNGYSHNSWSVTDAISSLNLDDVKNNFDTNQKIVPPQQKRRAVVYTDLSQGILYPSRIGAYNTTTKVIYKGYEYQCMSLGVGSDNQCNTSSNIPGSLLAESVWKKVEIVKYKPVVKEKKLDLSGDIKYPYGIGHYKSGMVVSVGDQKFECMSGAEDKCNDSEFSPHGARGYMSWIDITHDIDERGYVHSTFSQESISSEYMYPVGIGSYIAGTRVSVNGVIYRCKSGHGSELCSLKAYNPTGPYGADVWDEVSRK
jgi:hypothetical protein